MYMHIVHVATFGLRDHISQLAIGASHEISIWVLLSVSRFSHRFEPKNDYGDNTK